MSKNLSPIKRAIGYSLIGLVWFVLLTLLGFFAMVTAIYTDLKAPHQRFLTKNGGLETVARQLYMDCFRPIWQSGTRYISFDEELVYAPRIGAARFYGPEFDTTINIKPNGLRSQSPISGDGNLIVITGDSQAFGWGVNDESTFSAILGSKYDLRTANAAVPSYGTARELLRLRKLGLLAKASVVVIQYCNNDVTENRDFVENPDFIQKRGARALWDSLQHFTQIDVTYPIVTKNTYQFLRDTLKTEGMAMLLSKLLFPAEKSTGKILDRGHNAKVMAADFLSTLDAFPELGGKTVIVLEISCWGEKTNFITELGKLSAERRNLITLDVPFVRSDFFRLDDHMNSAGHEKTAAILQRSLNGISR